MLKEIFENIVSQIKTLPQFADLPGKYVSRYHGEFEEGFDWLPVLPSALLYISNSRIKTKSSSEIGMRTITQLIIFAADKDDSLQLAEDIADILDGAEFEIDQMNYFASYISLEFYTYLKQVEVYKIIVDVS